jgi:hypothetical protein
VDGSEIQFLGHTKSAMPTWLILQKYKFRRLICLSKDGGKIVGFASYLTKFKNRSTIQMPFHYSSLVHLKELAWRNGALHDNEPTD